MTCPVCDDTAFLVESGERYEASIARRTVSSPDVSDRSAAESLRRHLARHRRYDLLDRLNRQELR